MLLTRLPFDQTGFEARPAEPPALVRFDRLDLHGRIALLACLDIAGSLALGVLVIDLYGAALPYHGAQLWTGAAGFAATWLLVASSQRLYDYKLALAGRRMARRAAATCLVTFGIILALTFGFKLTGAVSRFCLLSWAASTTAWVVVARLEWDRRLQALLRAGRCLDRTLVLAGSKAAAERIAAALERESDGRMRVVASRPLPGAWASPSSDWIEDAVRGGAVDRVLIAEFDDLKDETNTLLARLSRLAVDVTLMPDVNGIYMPCMRVQSIGCIPALDVAVRPLTADQAIWKRAEDVIVAGVALALLLPLFPIVALAIRLDSPGPVFFRQQRVGFHDQVFRVWKLRTMRHDLRDEGSVRQTSRNDPRVTRVGRFLRRTSLDELPQLINVLSGDMSIVGPRPHALQMTTGGLPMQQMLADYASRHRTKPGITGWAQVNGYRGEVDDAEKLRRRIMFDCYYIDHWSLAFDLWIMLRTVVLLAFDRHAY